MAQTEHRRLSARSLWRQRDFMALWAGQTISQLGTQVSTLAFPLTAVLWLDATPAEMGLLGVATTAPTLLFGLFAGVWVDRWARRPVMLAADIARAALLASVPAAAAMGALSLAQLYVVAFCAGVCSLAFQVAYGSLLPSLIGREQLVDGNSKLEISRSAAEVAGPGLAGALTQLATAPLAVAADAVSFLLSAACLRAMRVAEPAAASERRAVRREIVEGVRFVVGHRLLRPLAGSVATLQYFNAMLEAVLLVYLSRGLDVSAGALGVIFAAGNVGFIVGALAPGRLARRVGLGTSMLGATLLIGVSDLLVPLAVGPRVVVFALLLTAQFGFGFARTVFSVNQASLRQSVTPDAMLGRMTASMLFLTAGLTPLGAAIGGLLGSALSPRLTLVIAGVGESLAAVWLLAPRLRRLRDAPQFAHEL